LIKLDQLTILLIGWSLGFPAALLLDWIRKLSRRRELKKVIKTEMADLQYTMALNSYLMHREGGALTNAFLDWLEPIARNYHGPATMPGLHASIAQLRGVSEEYRKRAFLVAEKPDRGLYPKQHALPFLTAHVADLSVLPMEFQAAVLRVKTQLELFNQHVAFVQKRHDMTFSVPDEKYDRVVINLREGVSQLAQIAEDIAKTISSPAIVK
jgi:hypothetical protein